MTVKVTKDITKDVLRALKSLQRDRVLVGVPAENAFRDPDGKDPSPEINNAEIGYLNEFGVPERNIPARPHLIPGVAKVTPKVADLYKKGATALLNGDKEAIAKAHYKVGALAAASVVETIDAGLDPALSEVTIAKRRAAGRSGTDPLKDTGKYRRAITSVTQPANTVKTRGKRS